MAPESESNLRLKIGHVLFIHLVGYSKLLIEEQKERQRQLTDILLATAQVAAATNEELVRLPTGDGMALVFWNSSEEPAQCALGGGTSSNGALGDAGADGNSQRTGERSGRCERADQYRGRGHQYGATRDGLRRCGSHSGLSKHVADDLENYGRWQPLLYDLGEAEVKHGVRVHLVNLYGDGFGRSEIPTKLMQTEQSLGARAHRRRKWQFIGAALFFALLCSGGLWLYFRQPPRTPVIPEKSIAVLPLENLSEKESDANFVNGVHDQILTDLAKVADLKVISRTSTMQYRTGMERNIREIGKVLGAAHVVEGSVQRDGRRVRVNVQLIDARTHTHLWAESYDRDVADTFALESELAETIVARLKAKLSPAEKAAIEEESTSDPLAHDLYLEANALITAPLMNVQGTQNLFEAADLLEKAVARIRTTSRLIASWRACMIRFTSTDPTTRRPGWHWPVRQSKPRNGCGPMWAKHTLLLPNISTAAPSTTMVPGASWNWPGVPCRTKRPGFELAGFVDRRQGRWDAATRTYVCALELDPRNTYTLQQLAVSYYYLRRYADQSAILDRALAILPNDAGLRVTRARLALRRRADPGPLNTTIATIVAEDPAAVPGLADEWLNLALCQRDPAGLDRALAAMTSTGYSNAGFVFPRSWCEAIAARMAGREEAAESLSPPRAKRSRERCAIGLTTANPFVSSA